MSHLIVCFCRRRNDDDDDKYNKNRTDSRSLSTTNKETAGSLATWCKIPRMSLSYQSASAAIKYQVPWG
jgi:hypothetical protein